MLSSSLLFNKNYLDLLPCKICRSYFIKGLSFDWNKYEVLIASLQVILFIFCSFWIFTLFVFSTNGWSPSSLFQFLKKILKNIFLYYLFCLFFFVFLIFFTFLRMFGIFCLSYFCIFVLCHLVRQSKWASMQPRESLSKKWHGTFIFFVLL